MRAIKKHLQRNLRRVAGFELPDEIEVPVTIDPVGLETTVRMRPKHATKWEIIDPEQQAKRIEKEVFDHLTEGYPEYEYGG